MNALSAHTVYPNTHETDKLPEVLHEVILSSTEAIRIMAAICLKK